MLTLLLAAVFEPLWPSPEQMPLSEPGQFAAPSAAVRREGFDRAAHRMPYLEWSDPPAGRRTDACMLLISGGAYNCTCDEPTFRPLEKKLLDNGVTCVWLWYRVPRPKKGAIYATAWADGQRAVRLVRSQAKARGFDPEKIGVLGCSAGSHLSLLLATSALTPAYAKVDALDETPCHVNWAVPMCPAYVLTDGLTQFNARAGRGPDVRLDSVFAFDAKTCPTCLFHGGTDPVSPLSSTRLCQRYRQLKVPVELHLDPDRAHGPVSAAMFERALEFMRQMGYLGLLAPEEPLLGRFASDEDRGAYETEEIWPAGKMPDVQTNQTISPRLEWHFPKKLTTKAIQIAYSGGGYTANRTDSFEVAPLRRYLNAKGMTVVTLTYRAPRPPAASGLQKHIPAWQDLQRAIRIVRSKAAAKGLDPDRIGISGASAGGHLTIMGATTSLSPAYGPIDAIDKLPCSVQWGIAFYPAYVLTDAIDRRSKTGGNGDDAVLVPEFAFDLKTCPMLFLHGDADVWGAMNSVRVWEKLCRMGVQGELHTYATRKHCLHRTASPGTGSYTCLDRIWDFMTAKGYNR